MENTGLQRVELKELTPDLNNALIVGIIIAKQRPRTFNDTKNGEAGRERAVWNFTLRDSPLCYINVTCWSTKDIIYILNNNFQVGDVINIIQPQIEIRKINGPGEQFRPMVTSPYTLTLNEISTQNMIKHQGNCNNFYKLLHLVTKPVAGAVTISDIHNFKKKIDGIDVIGIVRLIGKVRNIKTREGIEQQVREIMILDQTSSALRVTIWEPDLIARASSWKIASTVLFITDVRCEWSDFSRAMVATLTSRTVITEDPIGVEAQTLKEYAKKLNPSSVLDQVGSAIPNIHSIQNVMNIQQVLDKAYGIFKLTNVSFEQQQFTALLYAVITQLDLDGLSRLITNKCSRCDSPLDSSSSRCSNLECAGTSTDIANNIVTTFDLRLMLSDQTGSLTNCRLNGHVAESVLNCSVQQFLSLSDEQKSILKWKLLMERCAIRIHVMCIGFRSPTITILSCTLAAPSEVANRLPHY